MLKINKKLSKKGFSLIELMVAVVILALAIFGIFHAYSVGFMGMADARDRTVATNYLREAMENVKNTDFDKIQQTYKSVTNANKEYKIYVTFSAETDNLKKIFTIVEWEDRNGIKKTIESSMLVHFIEVFALDPAKIVLFADSYAILNNGGTTQLTAVVKDIKGNTITNWNEGNISFSIETDTEYGIISNITPTTNGIAKATFTSNGAVGVGEIGVNIIKASVYLPDAETTVTDTVNIKVTDGPVKIGLTANPGIFKSNNIECSTITVSLQNAVGGILKKDILVSDVEITFSVFGDFVEGDLSDSTIKIPVGSSEYDAVGTITLCPNSKRGLATIIATSTGLESGKVDVKYLGPPVSMLISANPNSIYVDDPEGSTIAVGLIDKNGFYTNPDSGDITVSLALTTDPDDPYAYIETDSLNFDSTTDPIGVIKTTKFKGQRSMGTAIITASGGGLIEDSVTISIKSALVPDHIELTTTDPIVAVGGTSAITATVYDGSKIVTNYSGTITFHIEIGLSSNDIPITTTNGIATTELSSVEPGSATITASSLDGLNSLESLTVGFYSDAHHITLTAYPKNVKLSDDGGNTSTITATVCDLNNIIVLNYIGITTFTKDKDFGTFSVDDPIGVEITNGIATIDISYDSAETFTVTTIDSSPSLIEGSVEVVFYEKTAIKLVDDIAIYSPENFKVTFGVTAIVEDILVEQMQISWNFPVATERLQKIVIGIDEVYTGNSLSGAILNIDETTLDAGAIYPVELTFGKEMPNKTFTVTFYAPTLPPGVFPLGEGFTPASE